MNHRKMYNKMTRADVRITLPPLQLSDQDGQENSVALVTAAHSLCLRNTLRYHRPSVPECRGMAFDGDRAQTGGGPKGKNCTDLRPAFELTRKKAPHSFQLRDRERHCEETLSLAIMGSHITLMYGDHQSRLYIY